PHRVDTDEPDVRLLLLQVLAGAADGSPRAHAGDEDVELVPALLPDLRPGGGVVGAGVTGVVVLVGVEAVGRLLGDALGDLVVAARVFRLDGGGAHHHAGAVGAEGGHLLLRHLVGHDEDALVALDRGHGRQRRPGVAAGRLDDGAAGLEPGRLRVLDHVEG